MVVPDEGIDWLYMYVIKSRIESFYIAHGRRERCQLMKYTLSGFNLCPASPFGLYSAEAEDISDQQLNDQHA